MRNPVIAVALALITTACGPAASKPSASTTTTTPAFDPSKPFTTVSNATNTNDPLGFIPASTEEQLAYLSKTVQTLQTLLELVPIPAQWAKLDPSSTTYRRIETDLGLLLVSTKSFEPYLDGFKVNILVGNMSAGNLTGVKIKARWGESTNVHLVEFPEVHSLASGYWTPTEFTITPASISDTKDVLITLITEGVFLRNPPAQ